MQTDRKDLYVQQKSDVYTIEIQGPGWFALRNHSEAGAYGSCSGVIIVDMLLWRHSHA